MKIRIAAVIVGMVLGLLGGKVWILIPWGIAGLLLGYFSKQVKDAVLNGSIFGFLASFLFMVRGYEGSLSLISRFPLFAIIGMVGAIGGLISALVGHIIKTGIKKSKTRR